ncbi:MAG TPA: MarR family transcriptional regulator, partial [Streptomyces sp.]|nr:MarR family transcriptional regulator [Streptomyces sp.]
PVLPAVTAETPAPVSPGPVAPPPPAVPPAAAVPAVPPQRPPAPAGPSPAYLALAQLGRADSRLALSAADCTALEALAAKWFVRGVDADYLTQALTAGLPPGVGSPVGFVRRRLIDKIPAHVPATPAPPAPPAPGAPVHRVMLECTKCGAPGRPEALPDGLCRPCRAPGQGEAAPGAPAGRPSEEEVRTLAAGLRDLLKCP